MDKRDKRHQTPLIQLYTQASTSVHVHVSWYVHAVGYANSTSPGYVELPETPTGQRLSPTELEQNYRSSRLLFTAL